MKKITKEKTKDILYGTFRIIILLLAVDFMMKLFAVVTLFMVKTLEMSLTPLQYAYGVISAFAFITLIIYLIPDDFFKRKKKGVIKNGNKR